MKLLLMMEKKNAFNIIFFIFQLRRKMHVIWYISSLPSHIVAHICMLSSPDPRGVALASNATMLRLAQRHLYRVVVAPISIVLSSFNLCLPIAPWSTLRCLELSRRFGGRRSSLVVGEKNGGWERRWEMRRW